MSDSMTPRAVLEVPSSPDLTLHLLKFSGREGLSTLPETRVTFLTDSPIDIEALANKLAVIRLGLDGDQQTGRCFSGLLADIVEHGDVHGRGEVLPSSLPQFAGEHKLLYEAVLRSPLWYLGLGQTARIFQQATLTEIVQTVLESSGWFEPDDYSFILINDACTTEPREYCTQYHESDLAFVSRLLEEEGIYYYFEQTADGMRLIMSDSQIGYRPAPGAALNYELKAGQPLGSEFLHEFSTRVRRAPKRVALRRFDYERARVFDARAEAQAEPAAAEHYDATEAVELGHDAQHRAEIIRDAHDIDAIVSLGAGSARGLGAGATFKLDGRYPDERSYLVVTADYRCEQAEWIGDHMAGARYEVEVSCIPGSALFRPPQSTARPDVGGVQTALVVGVGGGTEIATERLARVKVKFHWDRRDKEDDTSAWVRVAQGWGGSNYGIQFLPRIGHEVVVAFEQGDPDRPLVVASVYNGTNLPPDQGVADSRAISGIRTQAMGGARDRYHELTFDDTEQQEELRLHAELQWTVEVEGNHDENVDANQSIVVGENHSLNVGVNQTIEIGADRTKTVMGNEAVTIAGNRSSLIVGNLRSSVGVDRYADIGASDTLVVGGTETRSVGAAASHSYSSSLDINVTGDATSTYLANRTSVVGADETLSVTGALAASANSVSVDAATSVTVTGNSIELSATTDLAGMADTVTVQGSTSLTLKVGEACFITLDGTTITLHSNGQEIVMGNGSIVMSGGSKTENFEESIEFN